MRKMLIIIGIAVSLLTGCVHKEEQAAPKVATEEKKVEKKEQPAKEVTTTPKEVEPAVVATADDTRFITGIGRLRVLVNKMAELIFASRTDLEDGSYSFDTMQLTIAVATGRQAQTYIQTEMKDVGVGVSKYKDALDGFSELIVNLTFTTNYYEQFVLRAKDDDLIKANEYLVKTNESLKEIEVMVQKDKYK